MKKTKKIGLAAVILIFLVIAAVAAALGLKQYRDEINDTEALGSYRLDRTAATEQAAELYTQLMRNQFDKKVHDATERSHLFVHLAASEEAIAALGYDWVSLEEDAFMIARSGNGLFLLAKNEANLERGIRALFREYVDYNGRLLIAQDETVLERGLYLHEIQGPGGISLSEYTIVYEEGVPSTTADELAYYVQESTGYSLATVSKYSNETAFLLEIDESLDGHTITYSGNDIVIAGKNNKELLKGIYVFANYALGYDFAGTGREKRSSVFNITRLPEEYESAGEDWIEEREPIICLWNTNYSRGIYLNDSTSLKTDLMSYSDEQLFNYVRMMKYCGYTGIQVTDMCSAWAGAGGYEVVHERLRLMADAAHAMDMKFTLWVWGSEFTGYGWADDTVTYSTEGYNFAYENPDVVKCFEKYYSIYAELADCCDRVICHYYDPGNLKISEDVAYFAKMLYDKFKKINPKVDFGISCWADQFNKDVFLSFLGNDITLYERGYHGSGESDYETFRTFCSSKQVRLGTWAWNTGEMEIDQLAEMNFQPHIINEIYQIARKYDNLYTPGYWSEMDSNHVVNIFSLYCSAKLLQNPDRNVEELTGEVAYAVVGPEYGEAFAEVLRLIEDARSGETWDSFWWSSDSYILKSEEYHQEEIYERCVSAMQLLDEMIEKEITSYELPLPISLKDFLCLLRPQIAQIQSFASFRMTLDQAEALVQDETNTDAVNELVKQMSVPVSEYNTVVGLWGQIEARAQQEMLTEFCEKYGLERVVDPSFKQTQKNRIVSYFASYQKGHSEPVMQYAPYFQYGLAYGSEVTNQLVAELIEEGLLCRDEATGGVYIADWEHYKYAFN